MINKKPTRPTITRMKKPEIKPAVNKPVIKKAAKKPEVIKARGKTDTKPTINKMKKPESKPSVNKTAVKSKVIKTPAKPESKSEQAMKIMEAVWDDIQAGKVQRKDMIKRFIDEVGLTKAGASTYYGNIKKKLTKPG